MKEHLRELVQQALLDLRREGLVPAELSVEFTVEPGRQPEHGDYACNVALLLARRIGTAPRSLAEHIVRRIPRSHHVAHVVVAGPGFINFTLSDLCLQGTVRRVLELGERYGRSEPGSRESVILEYVSANPTGPLHVGHGRGAAYGDSLANLLEAHGHRVHREYYVNDAGRQMDILAASVYLRYLELCGNDVPFPSNGYRGEYVYDIARSLRSEVGDALRRPARELLAGLPPDEPEGGDRERYIDALIARIKDLLGADYEKVFIIGLHMILDDIREDLAAFRVRFDRWFSERSLLREGFVERALKRLRERGLLYERDGATWFAASRLGDEKDRVVIRENGQPTYFASDLGYLLSKFERGFERAIYVFGADHHGYVPRLIAAARGLDLDPSRIEFELVQFAVLYRGGEKVQMSTRSGEFVTLRELRQEVGSDAARFFYVMRGHDQHLEFDLELARKQSNENPVYYVQYAHARVASLFRQLAERGWSWQRAAGEAARERLTSPYERALLLRLLQYPEALATAAERRAPQLLVNALRELAQAFHAWYNAEAILVDDVELRNARLALAQATGQVLASGLALLGVSAPERM